ncbi:MAG: hypothetical protein ACI9VS_002132, partial [Candidatus Binatia bacterium]
NETKSPPPIGVILTGVAMRQKISITLIKRGLRQKQDRRK